MKTKRANELFSVTSHHLRRLSECSVILLWVTALAIAVPSANAATIALWTFEAPNIPADATGATYPNAVLATVGTGTAGGRHASAATAWTTPAGNGSSESFSSNNWAVGDYYQFRASTLGYNSIQLGWDQTSSGTGPRDFQLSYSVDGVTFNTVGSTYAVLPNGAPNPTWNATTSSSVFSFSRDLSAFGGLDDQGDVIFRLVVASTVAANNGTLASGGTSRVDNFMIAGTPVPEPGAAASFIAGAGVILARRRSRQARR